MPDRFYIFKKLVVSDQQYQEGRCRLPSLSVDKKHKLFLMSHKLHMPANRLRVKTNLRAEECCSRLTRFSF